MTSNPFDRLVVGAAYSSAVEIVSGIKGPINSTNDIKGRFEC